MIDPKELARQLTRAELDVAMLTNNKTAKKAYLKGIEVTIIAIYNDYDYAEKVLNEICTIYEPEKG